MPRADGLEDSHDVLTFETTQTFEFSTNFDAPLFTATAHRQGTAAVTQIEHHPVRLVLQGTLVSYEIGVVVARDFFEQGQE